MILKRILKVCGVAFLGCLIICLATLPFVFNQNNQVGQHKIVCADTSSPNWTFQSSNFGAPMLLLDVTSWTNNLGYSNIVNSYFGTVEFFFGSGFIGFNFWYGTVGGFLAHYDSNTVVYDSWQNVAINVSSNSFFCSYIIDSGFNFDIISVNITTNNGYRQNLNFDNVTFRFYDSNGAMLRFQLLSGSPDLTDNFRLVNRTYYFTNSLSDNESYQSGLAQGQQTGESIGYSTGYDKGYERGHRDGFAEGQLEPGAYSLSGLVSSVVMAPVNIFKSIFDFDILGFNMLDLVTGLITFAVVVLVIKFIIGGGGK